MDFCGVGVGDVFTELGVGEGGVFGVGVDVGVGEGEVATVFAAVGVGLVVLSGSVLVQAVVVTAKVPNTTINVLRFRKVDHIINLKAVVANWITLKIY